VIEKIVSFIRLA